MNKKGFTLIELLVTIAIIGILATIVAVSYIGTQEKSRDTKRTADSNSIKTALGEYLEDNGSYPAFTCSQAGGCDLTNASMPGILPYLSTIPTDPKKNDAYLFKRISNKAYYLHLYYEKSNTRNCTTVTSPADYVGRCECITGVNAIDPTIHTCS